MRLVQVSQYFVMIALRSKRVRGVGQSWHAETGGALAPTSQRNRIPKSQTAGVYQIIQYSV